jgi:hypothetical protein
MYRKITTSVNVIGKIKVAMAHTFSLIATIHLTTLPKRGGSLSANSVITVLRLMGCGARSFSDVAQQS